MTPGTHYAATLSAWFDADITEFGGVMNEQDKPVDCSGDPTSCPDNEGCGCYCSDNGCAAAPSLVAQPQRKKFELTPEMKAALEEANKTGALHALLPNGDVMFINRGEQPEDTADLDCPHCGGSGHKGDIQPVAQDERTYNSLIERLRRFADLVKSNDDAGVMARRVEMLTSAADAIEKLQARAASPAQDKQDAVDAARLKDIERAAQWYIDNSDSPKSALEHIRAVMQAQGADK